MSLSEEQGQLLVQLAYNTISSQLGVHVSAEDTKVLEDALKEPVLQKTGGTFVTLKKNGNLRGCIGNLVAKTTFVEGVRSNAISAAFRDYRFNSLDVSELDSLNIEVSILTEPETLPYSDWQDLVAKLRVGTDGVIIRKGASSATFLPQVWKQLPKPESFLSQLCLKAGLNANSWKTDSLGVETYQVQSFAKNF